MRRGQVLQREWRKGGVSRIGLVLVGIRRRFKGFRCSLSEDVAAENIKKRIVGGRPK